MFKRLLVILFLLALGLFHVSAQTVTDSGYMTVAHISSDGTIQDDSYRTIGYAKGIPRKWAAFYFFFRK